MYKKLFWFCFVLVVFVTSNANARIITITDRPYSWIEGNIKYIKANPLDDIEIYVDDNVDVDDVITYKQLRYYQKHGWPIKPKKSNHQKTQSQSTSVSSSQESDWDWSEFWEKFFKVFLFVVVMLINFIIAICEEENQSFQSTAISVAQTSSNAPYISASDLSEKSAPTRNTNRSSGKFIHDGQVPKDLVGKGENYVIS